VSGFRQKFGLKTKLQGILLLLNFFKYFFVRNIMQILSNLFCQKIFMQLLAKKFVQNLKKQKKTHVHVNKITISLLLVYPDLLHGLYRNPTTFIYLVQHI
jgi:uncharacterized membrane protein